MITLPPFDKIGVTPTPAFVNASPSAGIAGSIINALIFNALQGELQNAIEALGLTPTDQDYTQVAQAFLLSGGLFIGTFGGTPDALTATIPGGITIPALKAGMAVRGFIEATSLTASPTLAVAGFTTGSAQAPVKRRAGAAPAIGDLVVSTLVTFRFDGTNWRIDGLTASDILAIVGASPSYRTRLNASATIYVNSATGSDAAGVTGTAAAPFKTLQAAYNYVATVFELSGYTVTLQLQAAGSYVGLACPVALSGMLVISGDTAAGAPNKDTFVITPAAVSAGAANYCVLSQATQVNVIGCQFDATTASGNTRTVWANGGKLYLQDVTLRCAVNNAALAHISADANGSIGYGGGIKFLGAGGASTSILACLLAQVGGAITGASSVDPGVLTNVNVDCSYGAWAQALEGSIVFNNTSFAGAATGPRSYSALNGVIQSNGLTLPGNTAGSTAYGGQYV